ncbi:MAG: hypothetical protein DMD96_10910 [Candidatus Rokuibacteriota bacterium]|nr:MAG: hypothetical protein DMD96_10910 [Candidatus Rokubacteria bacterium]
MAVPDFQSLMMPLLRIAANGQEHSLAEARDVLAAEFKISDTDREEPLPSGRQSKFSRNLISIREGAALRTSRPLSEIRK